MPRAFPLAKSALALALVSLAGYAGATAFAPPFDGPVGFARSTAQAPLRDKPVGFDIWYPALPDGRRVTVGGNGVFYGTPAGRDATPAGTGAPVVVISHGAGGNAGQFGWIASALAEAGFVVVLPNHPGTTSGNASGEAAVRVWERPRDVTAVLDEITAHPDAYPYADPTRVAVLGFSAGGYTAMALSGARVDPVRLEQFCDNGDQGMSDCAFLRRAGVDLHALDLSPAGQDLRDGRISAGVVIDPGIVSTLTDPSLAAIEIPMLVLNLGAAQDLPPAVNAAHAAATIPGSRYELVPDAIHFSALAECKPKGAAILEGEGEPDPLCDDAGGRSRAEIHADLIGRVVPFLTEALALP